MPLKTTFLPVLAHDISIASFEISVGNLRTPVGESVDSRLQYALGYSHRKLDYGEFRRTLNDPHVVGSVDAYNKLDCISGAIVWHKGVAVSLGATLKFVSSQLAVSGAGAEVGSLRANTQTFDLGAMIELPLGGKTDVVNKRDGDTSTAARFHSQLLLGFAVSNVIGSLAYIDAAQVDPLPRLQRIGLATRNRITSHGAPLITVTGAAEVEMYSWHSSDLTAKFGLEAGAFGIAFLRLGVIDPQYGKNSGTIGFGASTGGIVQWLGRHKKDRPGADFASRFWNSLDVSFDWAKYTGQGEGAPVYTKIRLSF